MQTGNAKTSHIFRLWMAFLVVIECQTPRRDTGTPYAPPTELESLSNVLFRSIIRIQDPPDCTKAKKLICSANFHPLGFNNMVHMMVTCHLLAYGLGRVLIMTNLDFWTQTGDLEKWFLPVVNPKCGFQRKLKIDQFKHVKPLHDPSNVIDIETVRNDAELIKYEFDFSGIKSPFPFPPGVMPSALKNAAKKYHQNPSHWYLGHFFRYHLRRPNSNFTSLLNSIKRQIGFKHPIVGMHVRQGDKVGDEMNFVPEDHFIAKARHYFEKNGIPKEERRIFIATDTSKVVTYFKKVHGHNFKFLHVTSVNRDNAGSYYNAHYKGDQISSLLIEMMILMDCDFNIVTFSSYLGKVVYLIKQAEFKEDASEHVISLDRRWFFTAPGYQYGPEFLRYCLFVQNGTSLKLPSVKETFKYQRGDYCRVHSRERRVKLEHKSVTGVFVTHDRTKVTGVVLATDITEYPKQPVFAEDHLFSAVIES